MTCKDKLYPVEFQIIDNNVIPVLGLTSCLDMDLVKRVHAVDNEKTTMSPEVTKLMDSYEDVFKGLGCLEGLYHIHIDESATPVVHPPRKVAFSVRPRLKTELERMETIGAITKVTEATEWVNSIVVVEKRNGNVRVCLDPRDLNKAIKREHYPMKTVEEIAAQLSGATVFSTLDASSGFWHIKLDEESSKLTTFNTPFGRYRFLRLPFGINSAPEVFQRRMTQAFEDIDGAEAIVDDILIWGKDIEEHNQRLKQVLRRARDINLKLNKEKSKIQTDSVTYIGHVTTSDGIKPDPVKVKAIHEIETPQDKKELLRFMGMVNYLAKFIPRLSDITQPLRELLKKDTEWHWDERHETSFNDVKRSLEDDAVLKYYDVNKSVTLSVDSSSYGLGACLLQDEQPVSYASRSLNSSEQNYAQIEKELLAIVYGCQKYHQYIYGKPVTIETDHKPLEYLFRKPLTAAPPRLQRMMLSVQKYDLSVTYKPGKTLVIADTLSRAPSKETELSVDDKFCVHTVENLPISTPKLAQFKIEVDKDHELIKLKEAVRNGWPSHKAALDPEIHVYWAIKEEISEQEGLLLRGERLIVPRAMRPEMLSKIHESHLGIEKCKRRARDVLYWPGMNDQITQTVSKYEVCASFQRNNQKEPMIAHDIPDRPWQKVSMDLFELDKEHYIVITDYYSKYFEVSKLTGINAAATIKHIKPHFARHGIPEEVISDNGPQFNCTEFKAFAREYEFTHITSSPMYPKSNGAAERTVQTVKKTLKKAKKDKTDPNLALLALRNTPIDGVGKSPVQLLMGRRTRTTLPVNSKLLNPQFDTQEVKPALQKKQNVQKKYYDRGAKPLQPLEKGERVGLRDAGVWVPATVKEPFSAPRSYTVEFNGKEYRRNRSDLLKCKTRNTSESQITDPMSVTNTVGNRETNTEHSNTLNTSTTGETITRSGRVVRPPERFY